MYKDFNGKIYAVRGCSAGNQLPNGLTNTSTYNLGIINISVRNVVEFPDAGLSRLRTINSELNGAT
jgi:hypothetical protein